VIEQERQKVFTLKAILMGLMGVVLITGGAGYVDLRISSSPSLVGAHLAVGPFFLIMLLALGWNLMARRFPALVFNTRELVVVLAMMLIACFPPTAGLLRHFQRQLTLPWYYLAAGGQTEWEKFKILDYVPATLFPVPAPFMKDGLLQLDSTVYRGIFQGLAQGNEGLSFSGVPWHAWCQPLLYWGPLIVLLSICVMSLSLLMHRQWADHEQLSYPLAQILSTLTYRKEGWGVPDLFRNRLFWWGFLPVFLLYVLEYLHQWFPMEVPGLSVLMPNLKTWGVPLADKIPILGQSDGVWYLSKQVIFFSVIGASYFVASEIALTMGLSQLFTVLAGVWFFSVTGSPLSSRTDMGLMRGGSYLAYAAVLLYTGRSYYGSVFRSALKWRVRAGEDQASIWAARLLVVSFVGFTGMLVMMGLDWLIALFFALLVMLLFLVFTRIICETGIPFMQAHWWPSTFLVSLLGPAAVGPGPLVLIGLIGTVLIQDPRECLMPYVATGWKMADNAKIKLGRLFAVLVVALLVALVVGFGVTTWTQYKYGSITEQGYASKSVPTIAFNQAAQRISEMTETGVFEQSRSLHGLAKLKLVSPAAADLGFVGTGAVAVLVFALLRFRFARFPLHPVLFLVWGVYATSVVWASFLIGWAAKMLVVKFGGGKVYHQLRPFFVGLIAGELIMAGVAIVVGLIYYMYTGRPPSIVFSILVG